MQTADFWYFLLVRGSWFIFCIIRKRPMEVTRHSHEGRPQSLLYRTQLWLCILDVTRLEKRPFQIASAALRDYASLERDRSLFCSPATVVLLCSVMEFRPAPTAPFESSSTICETWVASCWTPRPFILIILAYHELAPRPLPSEIATGISYFCIFNAKNAFSFSFLMKSERLIPAYSD